MTPSPTSSSVLLCVLCTVLQKIILDYFVHCYAGKEVRDSPPHEERAGSHTRGKNVESGFLRACAYIFLVRNSRIYTNVVPLCILDRLRGMQSSLKLGIKCDY